MYIFFIADLNECEDDKGGCEHNCVNSLGGYHCTCPDGKTLAVDGKSCDNTDEGTWAP